MKKSWDSVWERIFQTQEWGKYPEIPIVRFVARNYYKDKNRSKIKILDLGCGPGAHSWYLAKEGFDVYGIDGSQIAIEKLKDRLKKEKLNGSFIVGDAIKLPYEDKFFDCIIDSAAIQHNKSKNINKILEEVFRTLKDGGKFFGMMVCEDKRIEKNYGKITFFKEDEIKRLFEKFKEVKIDYCCYTDNNGKEYHKSWLVQATKCKQ